MATCDIVVIGASAGGVEALLAVAKELPTDLQAAVFVVLHVPRFGNSVLPRLLSRAGRLPAQHAIDAELVRAGRIYVAPPDRHMVLHDGQVRLSHGPNENGHRPAIDPLFRSAARWYGARAIGVILSGALDDGTAGMLAIKMRGGVTVVQDPKTALYPSMPKSSLDNVEIDHIATLPEMGALLTRIVRERVTREEKNMPNESSAFEHELHLEADISESGPSTNNDPGYQGVPSTFACPDCHGVLWELREGELIRFRCRVGHAFLPQALSAAFSEQLDEALWIALRSLRENAALCGRLAERSLQRNMAAIAESYRERENEAKQRAALVEGVLRRGQLLVEPPELSADPPSRPHTSDDGPEASHADKA